MKIQNVIATLGAISTAGLVYTSKKLNYISTCANDLLEKTALQYEKLRAINLNTEAARNGPNFALVARQNLVLLLGESEVVSSNLQEVLECSEMQVHVINYEYAKILAGAVLTISILAGLYLYIKRPKHSMQKKLLTVETNQGSLTARQQKTQRPIQLRRINVSPDAYPAPTIPNDHRPSSIPDQYPSTNVRTPSEEKNAEYNVQAEWDKRRKGLFGCFSTPTPIPLSQE